MAKGTGAYDNPCTGMCGLETPEILYCKQQPPGLQIFIDGQSSFVTNLCLSMETVFFGFLPIFGQVFNSWHEAVKSDIHDF